MHRLKAMPGGWLPGEEGVVFVEQTPAPLVVLTSADTDIQALQHGLTFPQSASSAAAYLKPEQAKPEQAAAGPGPVPGPAPKGILDTGIRIANLLNLQQQLTIDTYADTVLRHAKGILVRLLGGRAYWSYGLEVVKQLAAEYGIGLAVLPGDNQPNVDLMHHSTLPLTQVNRLWQYFTEGGSDNLRHGLEYFSDLCLGTTYAPPAPLSVPEVGVYRHKGGAMGDPNVAILFYRSHFLAGNTAPIDALCDGLIAQG